MFIKRVGEKVRIKPIGAHSWFALNGKEWFKLKAGEIIEIPDNEAESIFALYGDSIMKVEQEKKKVSKDKEKDE